jgi:hypothetical protein
MLPDWTGSAIVCADEARDRQGILAARQSGCGPSRVVRCSALDRWSRVVALPVSQAEWG